MTVHPIFLSLIVSEKFFSTILHSQFFIFGNSARSFRFGFIVWSKVEAGSELKFRVVSEADFGELRPTGDFFRTHNNDDGDNTTTTTTKSLSQSLGMR